MTVRTLPSMIQQRKNDSILRRPIVNSVSSKVLSKNCQTCLLQEWFVHWRSYTLKLDGKQKPGMKMSSHRTSLEPMNVLHKWLINLPVSNRKTDQPSLYNQRLDSMMNQQQLLKLTINLWQWTEPFRSLAILLWTALGLGPLSWHVPAT